MPLGLKLNEIKTNITNVIANLQLLEGLSNASLEHFDVAQAAQLEQTTSKLLSQLEQFPCERLSRIQLQRKRRRLRNKQKQKLQKTINKTIAKQAEDIRKPINITTETTIRQSAPQHITLKKRHDASNILYTFGLLERLYKARGGEQDLGKRLDRMRTVWQRVQQESQSSTASEVNTNLETQWNQVFFGSTAERTDNCRGHKKRHTQELLQRRTIWDSFISYGNNSSSIPIGWLLPPEKPLEVWAEYKEK